jgi:hypothetical protein
MIAERRHAAERASDNWSEIDRRIAAAVAAERSFIWEVVGEAIGGLLHPIADKVAALEKLLGKLHELDEKQKRALDSNLPWSIN